MNDEIKEILDNIKEDINGKFEWEYIDGHYVEQIKPLLDYITNLQQENKEFEFINGIDKTDEPRYYMNKGAIEVIDHLLRGIFK